MTTKRHMNGAARGSVQAAVKLALTPKQRRLLAKSLGEFTGNDLVVQFTVDQCLSLGQGPMPQPSSLRVRRIG